MLEWILKAKETANMRRETTVEIETIRITVLNPFLLRFFRAMVIISNLIHSINRR